jgi:hypothetical protein
MCFRLRHTRALSEIEVDFDVQDDVDWRSIAKPRRKDPLAQSVGRGLFQTKPQRPGDASDFDMALFRNNGFESNNASRKGSKPSHGVISYGRIGYEMSQLKDFAVGASQDLV